eukprot:1194553-Prorocentrum_minimum.AAC.2
MLRAERANSRANRVNSRANRINSRAERVNSRTNRVNSRGNRANSLVFGVSSTAERVVLRANKVNSRAERVNSPGVGGAEEAVEPSQHQNTRMRRAAPPGLHLPRDPKGGVMSRSQAMWHCRPRRQWARSVQFRPSNTGRDQVEIRSLVDTAVMS